MVASDTGEIFVIRPGQPGASAYVLQAEGVGRNFIELTASRDLAVDDLATYLSLAGYTLTIPATPGFDESGSVTIFGPGTVIHDTREWTLADDAILLVAYNSDTDKVGVITPALTDLEGSTAFGRSILAAADAQAARLLLLLSPGTVSVADAAERKTLATYDPDGPVPGFTKVIQDDDATFLWLLIGNTVSNDAHWLQLTLAGHKHVTTDVTDTVLQEVTLPVIVTPSSFAPFDSYDVRNVTIPGASSAATTITAPVIPTDGDGNPAVFVGPFFVHNQSEQTATVFGTALDSHHSMFIRVIGDGMGGWLWAKQIFVSEAGLLYPNAVQFTYAPLSSANAAQARANQGIPKYNLTATTAPSVDDDSSVGYSVRSFWFNTITSKLYVCVSSAVSAAVWNEIFAWSDVVSAVVDGPSRYDAGAVTGTVTLDRANGQIQYCYMTGNTTFASPNGVGAGKVMSIFIQYTTGAHTLNFSGIEMSAAAAALLPITLEANKAYIIELKYCGGSWILTDIQGPFTQTLYP